MAVCYALESNLDERDAENGNPLAVFIQPLRGCGGGSACGENATNEINQ
jgi:hypothetical protein